MERKLIFFDIDGTLTSASKMGYVYESTKEALRRLQENGHFVALATGRAAFRAKQFQEQVQIPNMVCEGGNQLVIDYQSVSYELPDQKLFRQLYEEAIHQNVGVAVALNDTRIRTAPNDLFIRAAGDFSAFMDVEVDPDFCLQEDHKIRRLFLAGDEWKIEGIINRHLHKKGIGVMHYADDQFIIIEPDDKYKGIRRMVEMLNEKETNVVVFGDGLNDRQMFRDAPFAIAMENAIPELKELADYVCPSADDDGILRACQHFGWI